MSFRIKLLLAFTLTVAVAVGLVAWGVSVSARRAFEQLDAQRTTALVGQFRRIFEQRGREVDLRVEAIANAEATVRMALELVRPQPDFAPFRTEALGLAAGHQLDFVEIVAPDGTIVSSAQWPARYGYKNEWVLEPVEWAEVGAFLKREELPDGEALGLFAVRAVRVGDQQIYVVGGQRLDRSFLDSLVLPAGMRALLYENLAPQFDPAALTDAAGPVAQAAKLAPLLERVRSQPRETAETITWTDDPATAETFHAIPLTGRGNDLLGVLLVGSSRAELVALERWIRNLALVVGASGVLVGILLSWWFAARVTRPVEHLAAGARRVAAGNWEVQVSAGSRDELGEMARAFNHMTAELVRQRQRLVQSERVAAWRELARRLAHELKNPLFPLQITVENLRRAREHSSDQFDEVFRESTAALLAEIENLKTIIARFSDFARMPAPQLQPVDLNEIVRSVVHLFEAQFAEVGRPQITPELYLDSELGEVQADPALLRRALENLVLNAMDAMPSGGTLTIRTARAGGTMRLEVSDTGSGLTREECERLFTPYYTTRQHGTGLGLAIVQSVVSDHGGRIRVESEPGMGTTFRIELPDRRTAEAVPSAAPS